MTQLKAVLVFLLIVAAVFFGFRLLTPEDTWICENGSWQKHGNPRSPAPDKPCSIPQPTSTPVSSTSKTYQNSKFGFSADIPGTATINDNLDNTVSITFYGPTQKTQTELYDGYAITIDQGHLGANPNLQKLVEADIEQKRQQLSPDFKVIVEPIPYKNSGFYYLSEDAFGEVAYYYIPQSPSSFLLVTTTIKDPGKHGFSDEVGNIIDSLKTTK